MWNKALINPDLSINQAIQVIDETALQIALVIDEEGRLLGTVTDGDIRRALLNRLNLEESVSLIMNANPCVIYTGQSHDEALLLMRGRKVRQIPVLDQERRVVGLETADNLSNPPLKTNWVVLMAGGMGRRLHPITEACPKPLLKVGNKPVLETILDSFIAQGFQSFYFSIHYKAEMIREYFGDGSRWGVSIQYLHENRRLGTAGALSLLPSRPDKPLLLMNGDILTRASFTRLLDFHNQSLTAATACIKEQHTQIPYGVVTFEKNRLRKIEEKPRQRFFINAGLYVFNPEVMDMVPQNSYLDIPDLIRILLQAGKEVSVFPLREYWIDIGHLDDYQKANSEFAEVFG